jgi:hypothetical protein
MRKFLLLGTILGAMAMPGVTLAATNAERVNAIDNGLAYLAGLQNGDGSWSYGGYNQAMTGAAVSAFVSQKSLWGSNTAQYQTIVNNGLNYLLGTATVTNVTTRGDGSGACPGGAGSCTGVYWYGNGETTYTTGLVASAIGQYAAGMAGSVATTTGPLAGMTWTQIAQDVTNTYTAGQTTAATNRFGGWRYFPGTQDSDSSTTQWAVISMIYDQSLGATTLPVVRQDLPVWLNAAQIPGYGGAGCYQPDYALCENSDTGSILIGWAFAGKTKQNGTDNAQVDAALSWLNANWQTNTDGGWYGNFGNPYAMWADYKALDLQVGKTDTTTITNLGSCGTLDAGVTCNWWQNYNEWLVDNQNGNGSWNGVFYWTGPLATAFDVQILGGTIIPTAIPEPSTWVMMLAGLTGLGLVAHWRKERLAAAIE